MASLGPADHPQKSICSILNRHISFTPIQFQVQEEHIHPMLAWEYPF
jgi:hypothetical protein